MKTIDGRRFASRDDLIEHSGYSRPTLASWWKEREDNGHPAARKVDGVMHWDLEEWDAWFQESQQKPKGRGGRPPGSRGTKHSRAERLAQAEEALTAQPDRKVREVVADLAARHGGSPHTWRPIVAEARKQLEQ